MFNSLPIGRVEEAVGCGSTHVRQYEASCHSEGQLVESKLGCRSDESTVDQREVDDNLIIQRHRRNHLTNITIH